MYIPPSVKNSKVQSGHTNFLRLLSVKFAFGIKKHTNPLSNSISFDLYGLVCVRLYEIFALSSRTPRARRSGVSVRFVASRSVCGFGCLFFWGVFAPPRSFATSLFVVISLRTEESRKRLRSRMTRRRDRRSGLLYVAVHYHFSTSRKIAQATPLEDDTAERQPLGALLLQYAGATSPSTEILS